MTAKIIDGVAVARSIRVDLAERVVRMKAGEGITPGLAVILVGDDPASRIYVGRKIKACEQVGIHSTAHHLSSDASTQAILALVKKLNEDHEVHGILVQLPLPTPVDMIAVLEAISVHKDVDGFHLYNVGGLVVGRTIFSPCTPYGVMRLLEHASIDVAGMNAVVIGASNIVGKPMGLMLLQAEATVTVCHKRTRDLAHHTSKADLIVVAAGQPNLITADMVKEGAVVIDVGINRLADASIVGDVDFDAVRERASHITPVPGGVGPMTVTMLLENTIGAAEAGLARLHETAAGHHTQASDAASHVTTA